MAYLYENLWIIPKANWTRKFFPHHVHAMNENFNAKTDGNWIPWANPATVNSEQNDDISTSSYTFCATSTSPLFPVAVFTDVIVIIVIFELTQTGVTTSC